MVALAKQDNRMMDTIIQGDCLDVLRTLDTCSVDAIVTDPPAGIGFMMSKDRTWDSDKGGRDHWIAWLSEVMREALRCLRPGGHALVWALPRTSHWTATALEDAGFEIRDVLTHLFGSGFPKSMDISKQLDKMQGAEREIVGPKLAPDGKPMIDRRPNNFQGEHEGWDRPWKHNREAVERQASITLPSTPEAQRHAGTGTALKPANEHWILARKPISESSIAANVLRWSTGGLNIDASRVGTQAYTQEQWTQKGLSRVTGNSYSEHKGSNTPVPQGRFPSNLLLSHSLFCVPLGEKRVPIGGGKPIEGNERISKNVYNGLVKRNSSIYHGDEDGMETIQAWDCTEDCPIRLLDEQSGIRKSGGIERRNNHDASGQNVYGAMKPSTGYGYSDQGGASRYFTQFYYTAKASRAERNRGCEGLTDYLLDSTEIVVIELSHNSQAGGSQWENPDLRVQLQVDTAQSPPRVIDVSGTSHNNVSEWNTFLFGNDTMAPFLKGCKFTTVTKTNSITQSKTLNWLTPLLTSASIAGVNLEMVNGGNHAASVEMFSESQLIFTNEETVYLPGARSVASKTLWRISASVKNKGVYNNGSGFSGRTQINGTWVNTDNPRTPSSNSHPCVKPLALMSWLCRLITPPNGIVLDCFAGSGSTLVACVQEGFHFIGIEQSAEYIEIARARVAHAYGEVNR